MLFIAIGAHILVLGRRGQLGRRTVFISRADIKNIMPGQALETRIDIRRQHRSGKVPQMLDAIDVWQGGGDQDASFTQESRSSKLSLALD